MGPFRLFACIRLTFDLEASTVLPCDVLPCSFTLLTAMADAHHVPAIVIHIKSHLVTLPFCVHIASVRTGTNVTCMPTWTSDLSNVQAWDI